MAADVATRGTWGHNTLVFRVSVTVMSDLQLPSLASYLLFHGELVKYQYAVQLEVSKFLPSTDGIAHLSQAVVVEYTTRQHCSPFTSCRGGVHHKCGGFWEVPPLLGC